LDARFGEAVASDEPGGASAHNYDSERRRHWEVVCMMQAEMEIEVKLTRRLLKFCSTAMSHRLTNVVKRQAFRRNSQPAVYPVSGALCASDSKAFLCSMQRIGGLSLAAGLGVNGKGTAATCASDVFG